MASIHRRKVFNRIPECFRHIRRYNFDARIRLAADTGISRCALNRFLSGKSNPSFAHVMAIVDALESHSGVRLDPRELVSMDGYSYPTPTVCELFGCKGCPSDELYDSDEFDTYYPEASSLRPDGTRDGAL